METRKKVRSPRLFARIVSFSLAIIAVMGGYIYKGRLETQNLRWRLQAVYQHGFGDLVENLNVLNSTLQKVRYAKSKTMVAALSTEITRQASLAAGALATLPFSTAELEKTAKFLSQVGDYAYFLAKKEAAGVAVTEEETGCMSELCDTAYSLSMSLSDLYYSMSEGAIDIMSLTYEGDNAPDPFGDGVKQIESDFPEYAGLIYDGPFSEHISTRNPSHLDGAREVTANDAKAHVAKVFGVEEKSIEYVGDADGNIPSYCLQLDTQTGVLCAFVSKSGGKIVTMTRDYQPGDGRLSAEECVSKATKFLSKLGVDNMGESYYHIAAGVVTVNFAAIQDGVVVYPDLIKIAVSQDNGTVVGVDTRGYLMNHTARRLAEVAVDRDTAQATISGDLTVESYQMALIPTAGQHEKLCHEFLCVDKTGQKYMVYINVETGHEEQILILIEDENGTLSI